MASSLLDLGSLQLVSTTSGVQLQLMSQACFAPSVESGLDLNGLTLQSLTTGHRERPWVCRANRLQLALEIHIARDIELAAKDEMMQNLVSSIREAKLWCQLRLIPTSVEISSGDTLTLDLVTITLAHRDHPNGQTRRQLHKLGADVPAHDVKPPVGILTYMLEVVQLKLSITRTMRRKRQKTETSEKRLRNPQCGHSLDIIDLRVHAGAPARQMDDDRNRVQADAYTGFTGKAVIPVYALCEHDRASVEEQRQDDEMPSDYAIPAASRTSIPSYTPSDDVPILDYSASMSADTVGSKILVDDVDWVDEDLLGHDADEISTEDDFDDLLLASFEKESPQQSSVTQYRRARSEGDLDLYQPVRTLKRTSSLCEPVENNAEVNPETFIQLVDAALRLAICDSKTRLGKGMRVGNNKTLTHLADIAPSLWSPGYLPATSNRAVFLPTISHALWNVASKQNGSTSLSTKVDKLAADAIHAPVATGRARVSEERIAVHLWHLLQHELYDKGAGKLTPLTWVTTSSSEVLDGSEPPHASQEIHDSLDTVDSNAEYYCHDDFVESDEDDLLDSMLLEDGAIIDDDGENGIISQDGDDGLELLLDEPWSEPTCRIRTNGSLTRMKYSQDVAQYRREERMTKICSLSSKQSIIYDIATHIDGHLKSTI